MYQDYLSTIRAEHPNVFLTAVVHNEAGYPQALHGLSHNKKQPQDRDMGGVAVRLADKDGGHNKFLESIYVWIDVRAPRYWWQEADTFRLTTKQSESTMHTVPVPADVRCP